MEIVSKISLSDFVLYLCAIGFNITWYVVALIGWPYELGRGSWSYLCIMVGAIAIYAAGSGSRRRSTNRFLRTALDIVIAPFIASILYVSVVVIVVLLEN